MKRSGTVQLNSKGQSMVELAVVLPILLLVVCGIIDFGWLFANNMITSYGCREGARYGTIHADETGAAQKIKDRVMEVSPTYARRSLNVITEFTNPANPQNGDVKVTVEYTFPLLTPMAQMILGDNTYTAQSTCQMKAE